MLPVQIQEENSCSPLDFTVSTLIDFAGMKSKDKRSRCNACHKNKPSNAFSRNQLKKGKKRRCIKCMRDCKPQERKLPEPKPQKQGNRDDNNVFFPIPRKDQTPNKQIFKEFGHPVAREDYERYEYYTIHGYLRRLSRLTTWKMPTAPLIHNICLSYHLIEKWDTTNMHREVQILDAYNHRIRMCGDKRMTTYLKTTLRDGQRAWDFRLDKYPGSGVGRQYLYNMMSGGPTPGAVRVGICKIEDIDDRNFSNIIGYDVDFQTLSDGTEYGQYCNEGDIIRMELNMDTRPLHFWHNDTYHGVAFKDIVEGEYAAAVSVQFARNTIIRLCGALF